MRDDTKQGKGNLSVRAGDRPDQYPNPVNAFATMDTVGNFPPIPPGADRLR
jgi:hypothetical protein